MNITLFILASLVLVVVLLLIVLMPWLSTRFQHGRAPELVLRQNIAIFKQRLAELETDHQQQRIDDVDYAEQKIALQRQLLAVTDDAGQTDSVDSDHAISEVNTAKVISKKVIGLFVLVMVLMIGTAYLTINPRYNVWTLWHNQDLYGKSVDAFLGQQIESIPEQTKTNGLALIQTMQMQMYQRPHDNPRWLMLANVYQSVGAIEQAVAVVKRLRQSAPNDEALALMQADLLIQGQKGAMDPDAKSILTAILKDHPTQENALMFMAMGSFKAEAYDEALVALNTLRGLRANDQSADTSKSVAMLDQTIALAKQKQLEAVQGVLTVQVTISPALKAQLKPEDTLFVLAKLKSGMPMPYAVRKLNVARLLRGEIEQTTLSDRTEMMAGRSISSAKKAGDALVIVARISRSGNPLPATGDLEAQPVDLTTNTDYQLVIDHIRP